MQKSSLVTCASCHIKTLRSTSLKYTITLKSDVQAVGQGLLQKINSYGEEVTTLQWN